MLIKPIFLYIHHINLSSFHTLYALLHLIYTLQLDKTQYVLFASLELASALAAYRSLYGILSTVTVNQPIRNTLHTVSPYL